jgi:hypothetical protein
VRRCLPLISENAMGVKSIGPTALRVKGSVAQCVASWSVFRWSKVRNSKPFTASIVIRLG